MAVTGRLQVATFFDVQIGEMYTPLLYRRVKKGCVEPLVAEVPMTKVTRDKAIPYNEYCALAKRITINWDNIEGPYDFPPQHSLVLIRHE